jgi:Mn2+/Fe2+ NRAMP family transporter
MDEAKHQMNCYDLLKSEQSPLIGKFFRVPDVAGWIAIVALLLAGLGGAFALTWNGASVINHLSAQGMDHESRIEKIERERAEDRAILSITKSNTDEILKQLTDKAKK